MASPNFDELHARLSRQVEDPVTAASVTAGTDTPQILLTAVRSDYLNRATREFLQAAYLIIGKEKMRKIFQAMLTSQAIADFLAAGVAITSYLELPIDLVMTGNTSKFIFWPNKSELDNFQNPHLTASYAIEGTKLYAYLNGTILGTGDGAGTFYHIGYTDLTANAASDTTLPKLFWDTVVDYAVSFFLAETGKADELRANRIQLALKTLSSMG